MLLDRGLDVGEAGASRDFNFHAAPGSSTAHPRQWLPLSLAPAPAPAPALFLFLLIVEDDKQSNNEM